MVWAILKRKKTEVVQEREIVKSMYALQKHVRSKQIVFAVSVNVLFHLLLTIGIMSS